MTDKKPTQQQQTNQQQQSSQTQTQKADKKPQSAPSSAVYIKTESDS